MKRVKLLHSILVNVILLFVNLHVIQAQEENNTRCANISSLTLSLLTCSEGEELYSAYGHSAIRLQDISAGMDIVFNYGTFDFSTPFFYLKFLNGQLDYKLSTTSFQRFMHLYEADGRGVVEREILLSAREKRELANLLVQNARPENCFYRYDFFFDNCATRIRDIVFKVKQCDVSQYLIEDEETTYRDCLHNFVGANDWCGQGIDLILGVRADYEISPYDMAMLPLYLEKLLVETESVGRPHQLLERQEVAIDSSSLNTLLSPILISVILAIIVLSLSIYEYKARRWLKVVDYTLFGILSILSVIFWYMWLVSEIKITSYNLNVLWASVLYIPMICLMVRNKHYQKRFRMMVDINLILLAVFLVLAICEVQFLSPLALTFSLLMLVRNALLRRDFIRKK